MTQYYLPKGTVAILDRLQQTQHLETQNLGLLLDKYIPANAIGSLEESEGAGRQKDARGNWLRQIVQVHRGDSEIARAAYHRWYSYTSALQATHFSAEVDWRMVVGLGGETVLETDLTLHHLYGMPIIPGSALKGLTRAYAALEYIPDQEGYPAPGKKIDTDHPDIRRIFGTQDQAGTVIFFDAFPKEGRTSLVLDIMNPHYPNYYQQNAAPTNDQNPRPIAFLAVSTDAAYMFALALRQGMHKKRAADLATAMTWLQQALARYGVGGKTGAGYGYFGQFTVHPRLPETAYTSSGDINVSEPSIIEPYIRPNIPTFMEGQKISGTVLDPQKDAETLRRVQTGVANFCLRYREFPTKQVIIVIPAGYSGADNWRPGNTKPCVFVREEVQENCTVLICKP